MNERRLDGALEHAAFSLLYSLPTKLVTLWASSMALKRALATVIVVLDARLSAADVTQGVMVQGTTPET
jgi:hypothetical protein